MTDTIRYSQIIRTKDDVDAFIADLRRKNQRCEDMQYLMLLSDMPKMSRVRRYFKDQVAKYNNEHK